MGRSKIRGSYYVTVAQRGTLRHIPGLPFQPEECSSFVHGPPENSFVFKERIMKNVTCGFIILYPSLSIYSFPHNTLVSKPVSWLRQDPVSFNEKGVFLNCQIKAEGFFFLFSGARINWASCTPSLCHDPFLSPFSTHRAWWCKSGEKETLFSPMLNISAAQA